MERNESPRNQPAYPYTLAGVQRRGAAILGWAADNSDGGMVRDGDNESMKRLRTLCAGQRRRMHAATSACSDEVEREAEQHKHLRCHRSDMGVNAKSPVCPKVLQKVGSHWSLGVGRRVYREALQEQGQVVVCHMTPCT